MHKKNPPRSIQQQGLLRQRQAHRPCIQLSGESAGLLEQEVGLAAIIVITVFREIMKCVEAYDGNPDHR